MNEEQVRQIVRDELKQQLFVNAEEIEKAIIVHIKSATLSADIAALEYGGPLAVQRREFSTPLPEPARQALGGA